MMKLGRIGFYTLENKRAKNVNLLSPMWRCELILTDRCNFKCPYCHGMRMDCKGDMDPNEALRVLEYWTNDRLRNLRLSGGEPTLYPHLKHLVHFAKSKNVKRIAISTNGSADISLYKELIAAGVNDISISLDACCSSFGDKMTGGIKGAWEKVVKNIEKLVKLTYVTVGIVLTEDTVDTVVDVVNYAHKLGVADIRLISSAQCNQMIKQVENIPKDVTKDHPILKYRINHYTEGRNVRGIRKDDSHRCFLVIDDSAIAGKYHFPCIIYLREHGKPIGEIGPNMRYERYLWYAKHDTHTDPICKKNCLDVCIDYNNTVEAYLEKNRTTKVNKNKSKFQTVGRSNKESLLIHP